MFAVFQDELEVRKSLRAFCLRPKSLLNILRNLFFESAVKKCLKAFYTWYYCRLDHCSCIINHTLDFRKPKKKKHIKDNNCSGLPVEMLLLKVIKCSRIAWDFSTLLLLKQEQVSSFLKTMPSEIGFPMTLTSGAFLNKKRNKQTAMNYRTILIAAVFQLVHQVEKVGLKHHKITQNSVSFSYQ